MAQYMKNLILFISILKVIIIDLFLVNADSIKGILSFAIQGDDIMIIFALDGFPCLHIFGFFDHKMTPGNNTETDFLRVNGKCFSNDFWL